MSIDWYGELELDDGRPVELVRPNDDQFYEGLRDGSHQVWVEGAYHRFQPTGLRNRTSWWYTKEGIWEGGSAESYFTIRNRQPTGPDLIEEMFS